MTYKVELNQQDWRTVLVIIAYAAAPGEVRKPLIKTIQDQIVAQMKPAVADTTKPKVPSPKKVN